MYKCTNCSYEGEKQSKKPLEGKCPICGDELKQIGIDDKKDSSLDLNHDGKVDAKDGAIASKVMNKLRRTKRKTKK